MRRILLPLLAVVALSLPTWAQQQNDPDKMVMVPQRYVSAEGLQHQGSEQASQWIGIGREIGEATKAGLGAVVDEANRFGTTRVGTFIMLMVAWRIIGHDVMGIVLGVPMLVAGVWIWVWVFRWLFIGKRVLVKQEGSVKIWEMRRYEFERNGEGKNVAGATLVLGLILFVAAMLGVVIF